MAEGLVRHFLGERWEAFSAGTEPAAAIHPLAVRVMAESGIDISTQRPKSVDELRGVEFDLIVTLCDHARESCPLWLGAGQMIHLGFPDPAAADGIMEDRLDVFRRVRDDLRDRVLGYLNHTGDSDATRNV